MVGIPDKLGWWPCKPKKGRDEAETNFKGDLMDLRWGQGEEEMAVLNV